MNPEPHDASPTSLPDLVAFAIGIGAAWWTGWDTLTLVWSLWLSSLVVGYLSILIGIAGTIGQTRASLRNGLPDLPNASAATLARLAIPLSLLYGTFLLAFFSLHFGGFHWGHSVFLNMFFPIDGSDPLTRSPMPRSDEYLRVLKTCWWFIPLSLVAERTRLFGIAATEDSRTVNPHDERMSAPYRNVMRLHLLIFFFAFATFTDIGDIWVYLLVYAVYFFPWQSVRRRKTQADVHRHR